MLAGPPPSCPYAFVLVGPGDSSRPVLFCWEVRVLLWDRRSIASRPTPEAPRQRACRAPSSISLYRTLWPAAGQGGSSRNSRHRCLNVCPRPTAGCRRCGTWHLPPDDRTRPQVGCAATWGGLASNIQRFAPPLLQPLGRRRYSAEDRSAPRARQQWPRAAAPPSRWWRCCWSPPQVLRADFLSQTGVL